MKKLYIAPETNIYKVNVISMMATSYEFVDDPVDPGDFTDASREDNTDNTVNRSNVWDNIW